MRNTVFRKHLALFVALAVVLASVPIAVFSADDPPGSLELQGGDFVAGDPGVTEKILELTTPTSAAISTDTAIKFTISGGDSGKFYLKDANTTGTSITTTTGAILDPGGNVTASAIIGVASGVTLAGGETVTVTATSGDTATTFAALTISVAAAAPTYNLTFIQTIGGAITAAADTYAEGATVSLTAKPDANFDFAGWDKVSVSWNSGTDITLTPSDLNASFTMPAGDVTVTAKTGAFTPTYELTVTAQPTEGGSVTGAGQYAEGAQVPLTAAPNSGYTFSGWTGGNGGTFADASLASTTFTMPANAAAITANFTLGTFIKGTAYLWSNDSKSTLGGARVYVYDDANRYVGQTTTDADGSYSIEIPDSRTAANYYVTATSDFILARLLLNEDESAIDASRRSVAHSALTAGNSVDFSFVNPPTVNGRVVDANKSPIQGATVSVWDSVQTGPDGTFAAQSSVSRTGLQYAYAWVYASGYYSGSKSEPFNFTIGDFKRGSVNFGSDITLEKIPTGGTFGDPTRNSFVISPNTVTPGEVSRATLKFRANGSATLTDQTITIETPDGGQILVNAQKDFNLTKNGVKTNIKSFSPSANKLTITTDIEPNADYQLIFGVKAPDKAGFYGASASIGGAVIDKPIVIIHSLTVTAPSEIRASQDFAVYGEVVSDTGVTVELTVTNIATGQTAYEAGLNVSKDMGLLYRFDVPKNKLTEEGAYSVSVIAKKAGAEIATAETAVNVVERPTEVVAMSLRDSYNTVSVPSPKPGQFLTFVGWVDGSLMSMDYRNLTGSVTLNDTTDAERARFIVKASHGTFYYPASVSGKTYSAALKSYKGTGKADILFEVTKSDGSELTFVVGKIIILIDPSGRVYDAADGQAIEGAECTLYYKDADGAWILWPAADYLQINPQKTDSEGKYGWMVPEGIYKVTVTKAGYAGNDTLAAGYGELAVLPEQVEINIPLTKTGSSDSVGGGGGGGGSLTPKEEEPKKDEDETSGKTGTWDNPFSDVGPADWFYADVEFAVKNGLFEGVSAASFSPKSPMTRGMIVTVLGRYHGVDASAGAASGSFSDVAAGQYYAAYVEWARENGIVNGVGDGLFAPDANVSRQDFAVILLRYADFARKQFPTTRQFGTFADDADIAGYAKNAVRTLYNGGIINGVGGNAINPKGSASRAEVAAMLHRFIDAVGGVEAEAAEDAEAAE